MTFWRLSFCNNKYLLANRRGRGLSSPLFPPVKQVQLEVETHPVTVGFSTVWQSLTTGVPCFSTRAVYYCICGSNNPSTDLLSRVAFSPTLCDQLFANTPTLKLISSLGSLIFYTKHYQIPFYSVKLITLCSISWIPFVYLLEHPSTPASGTLPTGQQHNRYFVNTPFISSTHHCFSLLIAFNTLFLSRFPLFSLFCGHNTSVMRVYKYGRPIVWVLSVFRT